MVFIENHNQHQFERIGVAEDGPGAVAITFCSGDYQHEEEQEYSEISLDAEDAKLLAMMILSIAERAEAS